MSDLIILVWILIVINWKEIYIDTDESSGEPEPTPKKQKPKQPKKTSRAVRESDLQDKEKSLAEIITTIREMHSCALHGKPCWIDPVAKHHLQLGPNHLHLWANSVVS
jgi:hypothetical protein